MSTFLERITSLLPASIAYAHCDVPCGIYDPKPAQIAAATVLKMVEKLEALPLPADDAPAIEFTKHHNSAVRMILTKEEHAQKCKTELLILWTDYFKPEHLTQFPKLHDTFWQAAKLCSKNKQEVSKDAALALVKAVDEIAGLFEQSKVAHSH